ncbi:MAG: AAA family ATPase, partial [Bacteroidota bacterium]
MYLTDYTFTDAAHQAIRLAKQLADEYSHANYGAAHLLWAITREDVGLGAVYTALEQDALELGKWAMAQVMLAPKTSRYVASPPGDESALTVFKECNKLCLRYGQPEISTLDLLESLLTPEVGFTTDLVRRMPLALYEIIDYRNKHEAAASVVASNQDGKSAPTSPATGGADGQLLEKYCTNLNEQTAAGKTDPLIGRDLELKQLLEILGKRISPNVMLVGEPGVGKTAMLGGITAAILADEVPSKLKEATVFELDVSGRLVAGAYKGEVEERLKTILKALKAYAGKAILFIDEIHILLDEKGPVGSGVVNLLKPELSRGEVTLIGATTQTEYQKYIEKDAAFNRRFSRLVIKEPEEGLAKVMLQGLMPRYEDFHGIKVAPAAINSAVTLAKRYVRDKYLPVSAIELLDFTMACAVQMNGTSIPILEDIAQDWQA